MSLYKRDAQMDICHDGTTKVQCSTGPLAIISGGAYDEVERLVLGIRRLGWPRVEMRLWNKWQPARYVSYLESVLATGVLVPTIHAPALTEELLSRTAPDDAGAVLDKCVEAARAANSRAIVFHGWDLRKPAFHRSALVRNLQALHERYLREPLVWCVEALPGYGTLLPVLERECPYLQFVVDTQWAEVEGDWRPLLERTPKVCEIHVQSHIDFDEGGRVMLGRARLGAGCDVPSIIRTMYAQGFSGEVTLEPLGVTPSGAGQIRRALEFLAELELLTKM